MVVPKQGKLFVPYPEAGWPVQLHMAGRGSKPFPTFARFSGKAGWALSLLCILL